MVTCGAGDHPDGRRGLASGEGALRGLASIASQFRRPGTRANIDEFTETTSQAIEKSWAGKGKA